MSSKPFVLGIALLFGLGACDDEEGMGPAGATLFDVRVENVSQTYAYHSSGVFDTPLGAGAPGPIGPGQAYEFAVSAAPGAKLSFATMFVHSNDFFYAPDETGIALFEADGTPVSGDVTAQVALWDAGTEVNQEPGTGADQAPRQAGPDTGAEDPDPAVRLAPDDFGNLPPVNEVIEVTLTPTSDTRFTVRIENVSDANTLVTSGGNVAVPLAPGAWVVHTDDAPLFTVGEADRGDGLEALAEDGDASALGAAVVDETGLTVPLSPGVWAVHMQDGPLFTAGEADRGLGLEALAEDGDPAALAASLDGSAGVMSSGAFTTGAGAAMAGPIGPGAFYVFSVMAEPGDRLSLATMFVQSNDLFYAPDGTGIALFDANGMAFSGDVTAQLMLWDAGTEANEEPGVGLNQAPRQAGPDTGDDEAGTVALVNDAYTYPDVSDIILVTVTPRR